MSSLSNHLWILQKHHCLPIDKAAANKDFNQTNLNYKERFSYCVNMQNVDHHIILEFE